MYDYAKLFEEIYKSNLTNKSSSTPKTKISYVSEYDDGEKHIKITSDGKTTKVKDMKSGAEGISECHPDDKFSLKNGIKVATKRMEEVKKPEPIKEGDWAFVKDNKFAYPAEETFAIHNLTNCECVHYAYECPPANGTKVYVKRIVENVAIVSYGNSLMLFNARGLEKCNG